MNTIPAAASALLEESLIGPIFVERQRLLDLHRKDKEARTLAARAAGADNPVAEMCRLSDPGLAGCERADAVNVDIALAPGGRGLMVQTLYRR